MAPRKATKFVFLLIIQMSSCASSASSNFSNSTATNQIQSSCQTSKISARGIGITVFLIIVIVVAVVGNVIVIAGILYSSSLRSQVTNYFIISLAVSDILIPLIILPFRIMTAIKNGSFCSTDIACKTVLVLSTYFDIASITNILIISIDRFIAVSFPLKYSSIISEKRALASIAFVWLYSATWAGLGIFDWRSPNKIALESLVIRGAVRCGIENKYYWVSVYTIVLLVPLFAIGIIYLVILHEALKHVRAIGALEVELKQRESKTARRRRMKQFNSMKSVSVVYGAFLVCWLPSCVITLHALLNEKWWSRFQREHPDLFHAMYFLFILILPPLNCTLNPFIYSLLHKNFRTAFSFTVHRMLGKRFNRRLTETSFRNSYEIKSKRKRDASRSYGVGEDGTEEHKF